MSADDQLRADLADLGRRMASEGDGSKRVEDGASLLDEVAGFVRRYVVMGDDQAVAVVLWLVHSHAVDAAESTPYLAVTSAEKRSGKSRLLEVAALLTPKPLAAADVSAAALFRTIADDRPTLLLDEVDALFNRKGADKTEELRGLLNAGHRRGAEVVRMVGQGAAMKAERFPVFCAKLIAGIGALPDTIADRSVVIRMKRRRDGERVERFRRREVEPPAAALRSRLAAWADPLIDHLAAARPTLPDQLDDRAADGWEPLLAIADAAGGDWPERARRAALALSGGREEEDASLGVRLLADVRRVFDEAGVDRLFSKDLAEALNAFDEAPWGGFQQGAGVTPRIVALRLAAYDVRSASVRRGETTAKGYRREQFVEVWERYCEAPGSSPPPQNGVSKRHNVTTRMETGISADSQTSHDPWCDGWKNGEIQHGDRDVTFGRLESGFGARGGRDVEILHAEEGLTIAIERAAITANGNGHG